MLQGCPPPFSNPAVRYRTLDDLLTAFTPARELAPATISTYESVAHRLHEQARALICAGQAWDLWSALQTVVVAGSQSKSTYFQRRAALASHARTQGRAFLVKAEQLLRLVDALRQGTHEYAELHDVLDRANEQISILEFLRAVRETEHGSFGLERPDQGFVKRRSKLNSIYGLPPGWQRAVVEQVRKSGSKMADAVLLAAAIGCRPAELLAKIHLRIQPKKVIAIHVPTAKADAGRKFRTLYIYPDDPWHADIFNLATRRAFVGLGGDHPSRKTKLSDTIRAAGRRLWPKRRECISAYSFRHAISSDLKKSRTDVQVVALVLGHTTTVCQTRYGRWRSGRSVRHITAEAQLPVRVVVKPQPRLPLKPCLPATVQARWHDAFAGADGPGP